MLLSNLLAGLTVAQEPTVGDPEVQGIAYDSRRVEPGFIFVAVKGFKTDGHLYIEDAVRRGAAVVTVQDDIPIPEGIKRVTVRDTRRFLPVISARYYSYPAGKMKMVGVTGTNGKTTTTNLISAVYRAQGLKTGMIGTIHSCIGDRVLPVEHTTPESADLQRLLAEMVAEDVKVAIMEVSSHALALHRVDQCQFDTAVFTNITQDHLDFHGGMDEYLRAKCLLFAKLGETGQKNGIKHAVINIDDPAAEQIVKTCSVPVITYGMGRAADVTAGNVRVTARGVSFMVEVSGGDSIPLNLKLTGWFNVYNALAAVAVGIADGVELDIIKEGLESVPGVPGRFELVVGGQPFAVVVDYAHTPDGLENVLSTAREITTGKLITVFGCGGDRDRTKRPLMGEIAARLSDLAVVTSDNPRTEDPAGIIEDILPGVEGVKGANYLVVPDRRDAINRAIRSASVGDVVVIAGKGHEDYQIIGTQRHHFDDREEASAAIASLGS